MIRRYAVFQKRFAALGGDDGATREFTAVPAEYLSTGVFIPASHPEIDPGVLSEVDAESAEQAVEHYREAQENMFM